MPFIDDITCTIYDMSSTVYDITFTICVTSHNACISDITHPMLMTSPLYMASHTVLWQHKHFVTSQPLYLASHPLYLCHNNQWINFIKPSLCMTSQPLCVWHHMHYMWHNIHNLGHHTTLCMISGPIYLTSLPLYLCHHTHPIEDITGTICMTSHPVYLWHHIHYIYDIISTKYGITTLCVDDATLGIVWHSLHCRWQRTHCITSNHSIHDVTSTSAMTTQPLYQTSHPLYLCHHTVSTDISLTFVWHHIHLLCDIKWTIYNITHNPYVITLLYLWHHSLYIWNHI